MDYTAYTLKTVPIINVIPNGISAMAVGALKKISNRSVPF